MPVVINKKPPPITTERVMAFDVSTKTGVVCQEGNGKIIEAKELDVSVFKGSALLPRLKRMVQLHLMVRELLEKHQPSLVLVEGYSYASQFSVVALVELGTIVRADVNTQKIKMVEVSPAALKKFATGAGGAKKDVLRLAVFKRWAYEHPSDNVIDAFVLAQIGLCLIGWVAPLNPWEKEVVDVIQHPPAPKKDR